MKKLFLLLVLILSLNMGAMAQVAKTINVITEGTLSTLLTANEQSTVTNLTVTGNINSDDFAFMNSMTNTGVLVAIDLGEAIVNGNTLSNWVFASCSKLTTITIPDAVTAIGTHAFEGCSKLNSVSIPNSVTSIGDGAFQLCRNLTSVTIPNSVTSIGDDAFGYCSKLTSIIIPNSVTYIGLNAFYNCLYLTSVTIPNSVTSIGNYAFGNCINLNSIKAYNLDATKITLGVNVFMPVSPSCTLAVPSGSGSSYRAADQWKGFTLRATLPNSVLSTNASTASLDYIAGSPGSIDITSNTYWKASSSQSWLTLSANPSNDYGNGTLTFTASANIATTPRTTIVTLTTWDNSVTQTVTVTQESTMIGSGTSAYPFLIYTYDDLKKVKSNLSATYRLMADIDASASKTENLSGTVYQGFTPIGSSTSAFTGTFHGHGHVVKNLYINRSSTDNVGLIGYNSSSTIIDSLGMVNGNITGGSNVGGLVGGNIGTISICYSTGSVSGSSLVGGLVGLNLGTISTSYSTGSVLGTKYFGGLVGYNGGIISTSYSTDSVSGSVSSSSLVGGLVGYNNGTISICYSTGSVSGSSVVGGLVGYNNYTINTSYSSGSVSGSYYAGGLVGYNYSSVTITSSYWDNETSGKSSGIGYGTGSATGLTTAQMKNSNNLGDLGSFTSIWKIRQNSTYAALRGIDNAPFAFRDTLKDIQSIKLTNVLDNDYDYETKQTALVYKVQQIYGTGTVDASGTFTFPLGSIYGYTDSIRYRVGELLASGDTLWGNEAKAILIKTNVAPIALNDTLVTREDIAITHPFSALLQNDTDNDVLNLTSFVAGFPHHGTLTNENGSFIYTPTANWNGTDSLQYVVSDGLLSDTALVIVTVTPVNDAPVISSTAIVVATEDVEYTYTVAASDAENDVLSYSLSGAPAGMSITGNVITWTPAEGILSSGNVTLSVNDGLLSTTQTFTITVTPVNDAPVISSAAIVVATEDLEYTYTVAASDAENDVLSYSLSGAPAGMSITGNVITWTPAEGILSSGNVTLSVNDGLLSTTQTFTITVTPVNDAPVIFSTAIVVATEDVEYTYTVAASDAENNALSYSLSGAPAGMSITGNVITWTPAGNILTSGEITLTVSDGLLAAFQTFTIAVTPVNDAPVISSTAIVVATEDLEYTYTVAASDAENNALSYSLSGAPAGMSITGNVITWTPAEGILSSGNVTLTVNDGLLSTTQTFTIIVTPVNDAPVISSTAIVVATEDLEYTYTVAASDAENAVLSYSLSGAPAGMSITGNVITWTPAGNILTSGEITLTVSDGLLAASQTFTITVTPQAIVMATLQTPTAGCAGSNIDLSYTVLNGSPTQYRIIYDASALSAGFANIDYSSLPSTGTVIGIPVPSGISEGTYQASLQTRNSLTESVAYPFSFTIDLSASYLIAKFNDVILVDNSSNRFTAYQWYKDGTAISGATGQYYNDLQGLSGAYYALVQTATGESLQTCPATFTSTIKSAQVSLSAFPSPAASGSTISVAIEGVSDIDLQGATMDMINSTGAIVYRSQNVTTLSSVTLNQAQGTYVIRVTLLNGSQFTHKIIVIK